MSPKGRAITWILVTAMTVAGACSNRPTTTLAAPTPTPTAVPCTGVFFLGMPSVTVDGGGSRTSPSLGTNPLQCTFTAVSNSSFITVDSVGCGFTNGGACYVNLIVAPNPSPTPRSGTVTIAGNLTFTVNQGAGIAVSFSLFDPGRTSEPTTECHIRSSTGQPTTCVLKSTSLTYDSAPIVSYEWSLSYTYGRVRLLRQTGPDPQLTFTETCGQAGPTDDYQLVAKLTVTDSHGNSSTASTGAFGQPALQLRPFPCGS